MEKKLKKKLLPFLVNDNNNEKIIIKTTTIVGFVKLHSTIHFLEKQALEDKPATVVNKDQYINHMNNQVPY